MENAGEAIGLQHFFYGVTLFLFVNILERMCFLKTNPTIKKGLRWRIGET